MMSQTSEIYTQQSTIPYELSQTDDVFLNELAQVDELYHISHVSDESFTKSNENLTVFQSNSVQVESSDVDLEIHASIIFEDVDDHVEDNDSDTCD
ncbi:hypothetical protein DPMN_051161 [Dreissena polymorpha]|uniref:Uncharacterized protein n=1 Tax=Dreissena polymorpha TaxID=45954 RepID=A0A9D4CI31_DREPO|nr:hypothetical protein DPMN_051161 [Dreissena polymorpha]